MTRSRMGRMMLGATCAMVVAFAAAESQVWRPGVLADGRDVTFPRDTIWDSPTRYREALPATIRALPILRRVADAETEGASFPWRPVVDTLRESYLAQHTGSATRTCVTAPSGIAGENANVRAGDFILGGNISHSRGSDVFWSPLRDPSVDGQGLLVRFARIDSAATSADTLRKVQLMYKGAFTMQVWARSHPWGSHPLSDVAWRSPEPFFWSSLNMPSQGTWMAVATSGTDWGCVVFSTRR
jgi:hypothetical protein